MTTTWGLLAALLVPAAADAKEYALLRTLNQVTAGETITVGADFVEPQRDHYVLRLVLTNETTDRALLVKMEELRCSWGAAQALLKHSAFGIGERKMDLRPGETKAFTMNCPTGRSEGDFRVNLMRVYDDSTGDILFEDVTWHLPEAAKERKANQTVPPGFVPRVTDHPKPPPAGAAPAEPDGILTEAIGAGVDLAEKVVDKVEEELDKTRRDDAPAEPAEDGDAPAEDDGEP